MESLLKFFFKLRIIFKSLFEKNFNYEINLSRVYYFMEVINEKLKENFFIKVD